MSLQLMQMLSTTIEAKDEYTKGHSHRVAEYSVLIARELGWNEKELSNLKNAAHLHDIGKIAIPDTILNKRRRKRRLCQQFDQKDLFKTRSAYYRAISLTL